MRVINGWWLKSYKKKRRNEMTFSHFFLFSSQTRRRVNRSIFHHWNHAFMITIIWFSIFFFFSNEFLFAFDWNKIFTLYQTISIQMLTNTDGVYWLDPFKSMKNWFSMKFWKWIAWLIFFVIFQRKLLFIKMWTERAPHNNLLHHHF